MTKREGSNHRQVRRQSWLGYLASVPGDLAREIAKPKRKRARPSRRKRGVR